MIAQTVKSVLKMMRMNVQDKQLELKMKDPRTNRAYDFTVDREGMSLVITDKGNSVRTLIDDIEMTQLPVKLLAQQYVERTFFNKEIVRDGKSTKIQTEFTVNIRFEAHLMVHVFKLMRERAFFTFKHQDKQRDCYYIEGKAYYVEKTESEYRLMCTDLFKLNTVFDDYKIQLIDQLPTHLDSKTFFEKHNKIAESMNKKFVRFINGQALGGQIA